MGEDDKRELVNFRLGQEMAVSGQRGNWEEGFGRKGGVGQQIWKEGQRIWRSMYSFFPADCKFPEFGPPGIDRG